jgi:enterochelin esterase-like enzyme
MGIPDAGGAQAGPLGGTGRGRARRRLLALAHRSERRGVAGPAGPRRIVRPARLSSWPAMLGLPAAWLCHEPGSLFDGNNTVHVNRICEELIRQGEIRPIIVVGIENVPGLREWELTPWGDDRFYGGGQQFLQAIRDTLKPEIDRRFRTLPDAASTAIAGASLGGVFAAYAGIAHSETFGNVAAFSPSYWLDGRHIVAFADSVSRIRPLPLVIRRFYQDTGTDGDNYIGDMERRLQTYGFLSGYNFLSLTVEDARHDYGAWAHRYPQMLEFLFPPE